ncbi:MAG: GNAT family protein [Pseudomonadota bacterium]
MQACLDYAQTKGAWMVELYVAASNPRAVRFYERHGFEYYGRMPAAVVVDGKPHDDFYYCLELPH